MIKKQSDDKENKLNDNGNGDDISSILEDFHYLLEVFRKSPIHQTRLP
ncbi:MAG: hypothetical protein ABGX43_04890 [Nitrospinaceae bacterium]